MRLWRLHSVNRKQVESWREGKGECKDGDRGGNNVSSERQSSECRKRGLWGMRKREERERERERGECLPGVMVGKERGERERERERENDSVKSECFLSLIHECNYSINSPSSLIYVLQPCFIHLRVLMF